MYYAIFTNVAIKSNQIIFIRYSMIYNMIDFHLVVNILHMT